MMPPEKSRQGKRSFSCLMATTTTLHSQHILRVKGGNMRNWTISQGLAVWRGISMFEITTLLAGSGIFFSVSIVALFT